MTAAPHETDRRRDATGWRWLRLVALAVALPVTGAAQDRPAVVERIVAIVDGRPITLSDVAAATRLGLLEAVPSAGRSPNPVDALINRELILAEVRRYAPLDPPPEDVRQRLEALRARFADAEAWREALAATAMTEARLEGVVGDNLRLEAYLAQRFGSPTIPTEDELVRYYRDHEDEFRQAGTLQPFGDVREDVRRRFLDEQREGLVASWLAGLKQRGEIVVFGAAGP